MSQSDSLREVEVDRHDRFRPAGSSKFQVQLGLDGSGDHRNYHQLSKTSYSTKQVMSVCFALSEVKVKDGRGREARWSGTDKGTNKPQNVRPLALFPGKETKKKLHSSSDRRDFQISFRVQNLLIFLKSSGKYLLIF